MERGGGVQVGGPAPECAEQPAAAVPRPGLPRPEPALPAAGRQHRSRLRQVRERSTIAGLAPVRLMWSCCVPRVNLAQASVALRELITLDAAALASFCEFYTHLLL